MIPESKRTELLALMCIGHSVRSICLMEGMPSLYQVMDTLRKDDEFAKQYARAMLDRADAKFEELDDVSEQAASAENPVTVAGLRLKADNIKWQLARMNSRKYGDRADVNVSGELGIRKVVHEIVRPPRDDAE